MDQEFKRGKSSRSRGSTASPTIRSTPTCPHEVTVIKGRRFPTWRHCKGISFELVHAAKHVGEVDHLSEATASAQ